MYENGDAPGAIELKRPVGAHCHGSTVQWEENRDKLEAKKKLYIASMVCLFFMIGEVIGKSLVATVSKRTVTESFIPSASLYVVSYIMLVNSAVNNKEGR